MRHRSILPATLAGEALFPPSLRPSPLLSSQSAPGRHAPPSTVAPFTPTVPPTVRRHRTTLARMIPPARRMLPLPYGYTPAGRDGRQTPVATGRDALWRVAARPSRGGRADPGGACRAGRAHGQRNQCPGTWGAAAPLSGHRNPAGRGPGPQRRAAGHLRGGGPWASCRGRRRIATGGLRRPAAVPPGRTGKRACPADPPSGGRGTAHPDAGRRAGHR